MPSKYLIHTNPAANRFESISRSGIIAWEEGCLKCAVCVKKRCVYRVYDKRRLNPAQMIDSVDNQCMNCLRCVQGCPKELIHKSISPEYGAMGDEYWSPDVISKIWYQAQTGKIPVSGAGYPGPFSGPGFDSMWTDMSEIVRPTRDGIHGREYISTAVDLGGTEPFLNFGEDGLVCSPGPRLLEIPLPVLLRVPAVGRITPQIISGLAVAAKRLGTFLAVGAGEVKWPPKSSLPFIMPVLDHNEDVPDGVRIIEKTLLEEGMKGSSMEQGPFLCARVPMVKGVEEKVLEAARAGFSIMHLEGSSRGSFLDDHERSIKDGIRSVHQKLVEAGVRDRVTLIAGGGIAMAEHVPKSLICGADAVFVDTALLIALECRMCRRCERDLACPVDLESASPPWVARRVVNLIGAWHNQLLEIMGAMGIRDARRMRGEAGRAMFFDELDRAAFQDLGRLKEGFDIE
jgi:ferredoxin